MKSSGWPGRYKANRIALFNHKGGVGKTTLTANIAAALGEQGRRVLLVDADPQANLTSYYFESTVVDSLLDESDSPHGETVWSVVRPLLNSEGNIHYVEPKETSQSNVWLVPGDIRLAEFENHLHGSWGECFQRRVRGYKEVNSLAHYVDLAAKKVKADFVFYDLGPNIGPLNRILLLDCDYFIVPVACDLFSRRALKTLGHTLGEWTGSWKTVVQLAPGGVDLMPGCPRYLGYIPQGFRTYGANIAQPARQQIPKIEKAINSDIIAVLRKIDSRMTSLASTGARRLGEVQNYYRLVSNAQETGMSIWSSSGGGVSQERKDDARKVFEKIAKNIVQYTKELKQ